MPASDDPTPTPPADPNAGGPRDVAVLPPDHPYLRNLAALWAVDAALAAAVEAVEGEPAGVAPASGDAPIAPADLAGRGVVVLLGFGDGSAARAAFDRTGGDGGATPIVAFEASAAALRSALWQRDASAAIASGRLTFVTAADKSAVFAALQPINAAFSLGALVRADGPSLAAHPEHYAEVRRHVEAFGAFCRTSINTAVLNGRRTCENLARNLSWYATRPGVGRLRDAYRGKPAIVVSAGPSLRKNGHLLKQVGDRAVIIAVQSMLKPLLAMGVTPHFITSLDYSEISTRFFEGLPDGLTTELVAEPKASDAVLGLYPGPVSVTGNDFADGLLREMRLDRPRLPAGMTVAHLAWQLAGHLGCDPVVFVGQDLSFSDGVCYTPGTAYDDVWRPELGRFCTAEMKQWEQIARDRNILTRVPGHGGADVYTEARLFTYLQQFEREFIEATAAGRTVIDATEGGALKRGAAAMALADALDVHCREPIGPLPPHAGVDASRLGEVVECLSRRRVEGEHIGRIARETLPLLEEVRDHAASDAARANRAIARIDRLRAEMNGHGRTYDLVAQLTQRSELDRFRADRALAADAATTGVDRQRRQVTRDLENVRAIASAADDFSALMDDAAARVGKFDGGAVAPDAPAARVAA